MNIALILSGGSGQRFGSDIPKQYHMLLGRSVIDHVINNSLQALLIDHVVVALKDYDRRYLSYQPDVSFSQAGETRNQTLKMALDYIDLNFDCDRLIILDAVRPLVTNDIIDTYMFMLNEYDAVITCQHITDSLGSYDLHAVDRERYYLIQSPESYRFDLLYKNFDGNSRLTEVLHQLPVETNKFLNFGFTSNYKITHPLDLEIVEKILEGKRK